MEVTAADLVVITFTSFTFARLIGNNWNELSPRIGTCRVFFVITPLDVLYTTRTVVV
jgi:hypothetical protein